MLYDSSVAVRVYCCVLFVLLLYFVIVFVCIVVLGPARLRPTHMLVANGNQPKKLMLVECVVKRSVVLCCVVSHRVVLCRVVTCVVLLCLPTSSLVLWHVSSVVLLQLLLRTFQSIVLACLRVGSFIGQWIKWEVLGPNLWSCGALKSNLSHDRGSERVSQTGRQKLQQTGGHR